jgi:protein-S-isoprenylcysteine O-methyltransferase Ste14
MLSGMKVFSLVLALAFVIIAMILIPNVLMGLNIDLNLPVYIFPYVKYFGVAVALSGILLDLYCIYLFLTFGRGTPVPADPPQILVARGIYTRSRNPMYIGYLLIILGEFLFFGHLLLLGYFLLAVVLIHLFIVLYEEPILKKRFGETYLEYLQKTPRWL